MEARGGMWFGFPLLNCNRTTVRAVHQPYSKPCWYQPDSNSICQVFCPSMAEAHWCISPGCCRAALQWLSNVCKGQLIFSILSSTERLFFLKMTKPRLKGWFSSWGYWLHSGAALFQAPWLWRGDDLFLAKCVVSSVIWEIWVKDTANTQNMSLQTHAGDVEDGVLRVLKEQGTSFKSCCSCSAAEECHHFRDAISVSLAEHNKQQQRRRQTETCEKQAFHALETSVILQNSFDN